MIPIAFAPAMKYRLILFRGPVHGLSKYYNIALYEDFRPDLMGGFETLVHDITFSTQMSETELGERFVNQAAKMDYTKCGDWSAKQVFDFMCEFYK